MKKGIVKTCNGCLAFEDTTRTCPPGSPAAIIENKAFCGIGIEIEKNGWYKPKLNTCPKPKTITNLVKYKKEFFEKCKLETECSNER